MDMKNSTDAVKNIYESSKYCLLIGQLKYSCNVSKGTQNNGYFNIFEVLWT